MDCENNDQKCTTSEKGAVKRFDKTTGVIDIVIKDVSLKCLIDTGAVVSCLSWQVYKNLNLQNYFPLVKSEHKFSHAGGGDLNAIGHTTIEIQIGNETFQQCFTVFQKLSHPCLLGRDFFDKYHAVISFEDSLLRLCKGTAVFMHSQKRNSTVIASCKDDVYVPGKSELLIPLYCKGKNLSTIIYIAEPKKDLTSKFFLAGARCIVQIQSGKVAFRVINPCSHTVKLSKGTRVAILSPIKEDQIIGSLDKDESEPKGTKLSDKEYIDLAHSLGIDLRDSDLSQEQKQQLLVFLGKNRKAFAKDASELIGTHKHFHTIHTKTDTPVRSVPYRTSPKMAQEIEKQIKVMEDTGLIEKSTSEWSSPVVLVKKKNGDFRFAVDYRKLNAITENLFFQIPRFSEVVDTISLSQPTVFSVLDLASGFWQIPLDPKTKHKTAFITRNGIYQFNRLPFGLKNAPMAFSMVMNEVLRGINWKYSLVYIDDIIIFSRSFQEHIDHLDQVFQRLTDANLKLQPAKCLFALPKVPYLGHVLSKDGIEPDLEKTKSVDTFPVPKNKHALQSFLGLCNYYRKFVRDFAHIASPLTMLLKKDETFIWTTDCQNAFDTLRQRLTSPPILAYPNFEKEFILYTDASDYAIGYILGQLDDTGKEKVIAYGGRSLNNAERKWGITDKEGLGLVEGIRYFKVYLTGRHFKVYTDHSALKCLELPKQLSGRKHRWHDFLQAFDFTIIHKPGRVHQNADAMSRREYSQLTDPVEPEPNVFPLVAPVVNSNQCDSNMVEYKLTYYDLHQINMTKIGPLSAIEHLCESEKKYQSVSSVKLMTDLTQYSPLDIRAKQCENEHFKAMIDYLENGTIPENETLTKAILRTSPDYEVDDNILYYKGYAPQGKGHRSERVLKQLMVPNSLKSELLHAYHDSQIGGHQGYDRTYARMKLKYWWHSMAKDIKEYIATCPICQLIKRQYHVKHTPLQPLPVTERFQRLHLDFLGPLPETTKGHKHILLVVDAFTKWPEAFPLPTNKASDVARILYDEIICRYGSPESILTDQGQCFMSNLVSELSKLFQIKQIKTSPYHPQTNASCERMNSYILQGLRAFCTENQDNWHEILPSVMLAYRTTPATQSTTLTPYMLMFGQECRLPIDTAFTSNNAETLCPNEHLARLLKQLKIKNKVASENILRQQQISKQNYDKNAAPSSFKVGDHVLLRNKKTKKGLSPKLSKKWYGPYYVVDALPNNTFWLRHCDTHQLKRRRIHASLMKPYHESNLSRNIPHSTEHSVSQGQDPQITSTPLSQSNDQQQPTQSQEQYEVDKIYRSTGLHEGKRWYYVKLKGIKGTKCIQDIYIPRELREQFHIQKTIAGKARKKK